MINNIKNIIACVLCISITGYLNASPLSKIIQPQLTSDINQKVKNNLSNRGYTDFTGTWESPKCMGQALTITIENTADEFIINNEEPMIIGTMTTKSSSGTRELSSIAAESNTISTEWNEDKTQIITKEISIKKTFTDATTSKPEDDVSMHLNMTHVTFELNNEQLKVSIKTADYRDFQRVDVSNPTCVFTKISGSIDN